MLATVRRANVNYLLRHPWQLALAVLGICIGVAVIVAVDLANQSSRKAFVLSMDTLTGKATHQVVGGPGGLDEQLYSQLRVEHGVREIAPIVAGDVEVAGATLQLFGVDLFAERQMRSFTSDTGESQAGDGIALLRDFLTVPGAALMSATSAAAFEVSAGDAFAIQAGGYEFKGQLLGTFASNSAGTDSLLVTDIASAQTMLGMTGKLTRIDVRLSDDKVLLKRFSDLLPAGARLLNAAGRTRSATEMSTAFMTNLTAMSLLALLVGLFLIYNSASFSVLQRRQLIGVLRALGLTRRQVLVLILGEAAILGVVAAALGVVAGIWLGGQLLVLVSQSVNDFYFQIAVTDVSVSVQSVIKGVVAGVAASLVAAAAPALEAASYQPRLSLSRSNLEQKTVHLLPSLFVGGALLLVAALLTLQFSETSLIAGLVAVFLLIFGFALCVPLVIGILTAALAPIASRLAGTTARLAVSGIRASLSRTGVAIVALAVAVSATIGVSVMVDSFRGSVGRWLQQTLQADIYVGVSRGSLDKDLLADIAQLPGVGAVSTSRRAWLEQDGERSRVVAVGMAGQGYAGTELLDASPGEVWPMFESDDTVLVSESYGYQRSVSAGDRITLRTDAGDRSFLVAATYQSYDISASALMMSRETYQRHWSDRAIDAIGIYLAEGADASDMIAALEQTANGRQQIVARSNIDIRELSLQVFDRTFVITDVLYWLALGVAVIGIFGAMLAFQFERSRELAVLRALGMTPRQLRTLLTSQTALIGLLAGIAAIPLGLVMAKVLISVINRRAFGWYINMTIDPALLLKALLYAVVAALLAGIYPAIRAARGQPALAMREE